MSDDTGAAPSGGAPAEVTAPAPGGTSAPEAAPAAPPPEYLDVDAYGGHHVRTKVDGEEIEVPLSEALQGYSRQSDYTRKTQALAEQQKEAQYALTLQRALEADPQATLRLLQDQYGVNAVPQSPTEDDDSWLDDPIESRLKEYDQRLSQAEQFRADQELRVALRVLQQQFGEDFDSNAVVNTAMQTGRMDLANIHKERMFDKFWAQQQAQRQVDQQRQSEEQSRIAAKSAVTAHGGESANGGMEPEPGSATSIAEAYQQAKRAMGR
jgi:hypothetical protein